MSQIFAPYGFRPVSVLGQEYNTNGISEYPVTTDPSADITVGDPVALIGGSVTAITATPTSTMGANTPVGIFWGCTYIDSMGKIWEAPYLPRTAISALGFTRVTAKVIDDDRATMYLCPNGTLPANPIGKNAGITNFGTTKTQSTIALDIASVATAATLAVRILRIDRVDDPYPDVLVKWNFGVHAFTQGGAQ